MTDSFSVGILYSCGEFLRYIEDEHLSVHELTKFFDKFYVAKSNQVLHLSQKCGWIEIAQDGSIKITPAGFVISTKDPELALRDQLRDYILNVQPPWSGLLPRGREEAVRFFSDDIRQCFDEAVLLSDCDDEIVQWWDSLSSAARGRRNDSLSEIGRKGEKLSLRYERERTKNNPTWMAIESNLAGFDLQSVISESDRSALFIEVKTSEKKLQSAEIFISKNEWRVAKSSQNFVFHIWIDVCLSAQLLVLTTESIGKHIPENIGEGYWQSVMIPVEPLENESNISLIRRN
jgi:hypothetical protein